MDEFKEFENNNEEKNIAEPQEVTNSWEPVQAETAPTNNGKGMSIASMVLGIVSVVCCGFPVAIVGLILGGISLSKKYDGRGMAIAGVVLSIISLVWSIIAISTGTLSLILESMGLYY